MSKSGAAAAKPTRKTICRNKRAFHDYHIEAKHEAGLVLLGSEVKSLREGAAHLSDAYAEIREGELYLVNAHIAPYRYAHQFNHDPRRLRKLLMHAHEIRRLGVKIIERGFTLIPLELYFSQGKAKVELGLAKGKRQHDKREAVRQRDLRRERHDE